MLITNELTFQEKYDLIILNIILAHASSPKGFEQFPSILMGLEWEWMLNSKQQYFYMVRNRVL